METFEDEVRRGGGVALEHLDRFFDTKSPVRLMRVIASVFDCQAIPCIVTGGLAFAVHGVFSGVTTDVEIEVPPEHLEQAKTLVVGVKKILEVANVTRIRQWASGDPFAECAEVDGIRYCGLRGLLNQSLSVPEASGVHYRCWSNALTAIRVLTLPREYALQLNSEAKARFEQLWDACGGPAGMEKARDHACLSGNAADRN